MGLTTFGVVSSGAVTDTWDPVTNPRGELGDTFIFKTPSTGEISIVRVVQLDNNGCSQGDVLVQNYATLKSFSVRQSVAASDGGGLPFGVAAATIASQKAGYAIIGGYCEKLNVSQTVASGDALAISASTAGNATPNRASVFNLGTQGSSSMFVAFARARMAQATGIASVNIVGVWGG